MIDLGESENRRSEIRSRVVKVLAEYYGIDPDKIKDRDLVYKPETNKMTYPSPVDRLMIEFHKPFLLISDKTTLTVGQIIESLLKSI